MTQNVPTPQSPMTPRARMRWIAGNLMIETKAGELKRLAANTGQQHLGWHIAAQENRGLPVRIILLKARRFGGSTWTGGEIFARVQELPHRHGLVMAHDDDGTQTLFRMTQRFHEYLPEGQQHPTQYSNRTEIVYRQPHGSSIRVATAGKKGMVGRGQTLHYLHGSEVSRWSAQRETLTAVLRCVPDLPGTLVILESTAKGAGDEFNDRWDAAVARLRRDPDDFHVWLPVFVGWLTDLDCYMKVPAGYDWDSETDEVKAREPDLRAMGATPEQLYWRRHTIRGDFNGNIDDFDTEYPTTPDDAWRTTGRPVIPRYVVAHHRAAVLPYRKMRIVPDHRAVSRVRLEPAEDEPCWHIWRAPDGDTDYAIAGDVSEGKLSEESDDTSGDFSTGGVLNRANMELVALYRGRPEADLFGLELLKAHYLYGRGWTTPEVNAAGQAALLTLKNGWKGLDPMGFEVVLPPCVRIMQRQAGVDTKGNAVMADGWKTLVNNRDMMIDVLIQFLRDVTAGDWEGQLILHSVEACDEMLTFVRKASGKREHATGKHDDVLMMLAILLQVHMHCGRTLQRYGVDRAALLGLRRDRTPGVMIGGGVDEWLDDNRRRGPERTK